MKIASWNVNSLRTRMGHVLAWWDAHQPDVLLLQETKVADEMFPRAPFEERGLHVAIHGQKSYNGVAIVSRHPLGDVEQGFHGDVFADHARLIAATVAHPKGNLRVASAYVPNGESTQSPKFVFKEEFYAHLTAWAAREVAAFPQLVVGGDFNISADERDVDNPAKRSKECMFTSAERGWLQTFAGDHLHDALRLTTDEAGLFSWWDYRSYAFVNNRGMRIDYLFVSDALKAKVANVTHYRDERGKEQPSDHIPIEVELAL
ncbi:MAG: exodeoxyribonuclease III [Pseudomonadaceae bacterium]|nr:exodeoxyribonuclease III [Pseudomonadaceae bacterium]